MSHAINFEGSPEVGAYTLLTNSYCIIGKSVSRNYYSLFQDKIKIPICETLVNTINTVGSLCVGNIHGLLLPNTTTDVEMQHIRDSLGCDIKIRRISERLNALGNVILCNDRVALIHPDIDEETIQLIKDTLNVEVYKQSLRSEGLVGTYGRMNNYGMLVHPKVTSEEQEELCDLLDLNVVGGTVNKGGESIGSGMAVNDYISFYGNRTTIHEKSVIDTIFGLHEGDDEEKRKALIEQYVK
ncbi:eukaryotic translation initiation factor 6 [Binucleata daphniae]